MFRRPLIVLLTIAACVPAMAQTTIWRWDKDGDLEGWKPASFESLEVKTGMLRGVTKYDPMLESPAVSIDASRYKIVEFRAQSSITGRGEIFWHGAGKGFSEARMSRHVVIASSEPRVYQVDMSVYPEWQGIITGLRLDLLNTAGATIAVDYLRLLDRPQGAVPNAGFEDDFDGDGLPDGWTAEAAEFRLSEENATEGTRSALVRTDDRGQATLTTRVPLDKLGTYHLEADLIVEGTAARACVKLRYFDVFGKPLPDQPAQIEVRDCKPKTRFVGDIEAPRTAASADLSLSLEGKGARGWWDMVSLMHTYEAPDESSAPFETWRASWIWATATLNKPDVSAYLRKTFDLPVSPDQLTAAQVQLTVDDAYTLFVNGHQVTETNDTDGWKTPELIGIRPYLVRGRNVIAILARNAGGSSGALLEGAVRWPAGSVELRTDETWKGVGEAPEGWASSAFDDSAWPAVKVIAAAGREPWGYVPYEYLGPREKVRLVKSSMPREATAGSEVVILATLDHLPAEAQTSPLRFALLRDGEMLYGRAYGAGMVHRSAEGYEVGPIRLPLTRFLPAGKYEVALGYPRTEYETGRGLVIGALQVKAPALAEERPTVEVKRHKGLPTLFVNGRPTSFMHYLETTVGAARISNMADNGLHLYEVDAGDFGWLGEGKFDYSAWDRKVLQLLTYDPQATLLVTYEVSGLRHPWWMEGKDEELCRTENGSTSVGIYGAAGKAVSLASQRWRTDSGDAVRRFTEHCRTAPYAARILGYQPCSGVSWEWQHWGSVGSFDPSDYSEPMQAAFREWTRRTYGGDLEKLRAAWKEPQIAFEDVKIPSVEQRDGPKDTVFRDPQQWQYVIDFYKFYQDVMVDGIEHYFRIIKEASGGQALCGTYYGYELTMLSGARRAGDAGHFALSRLLESKHCDFLMSPLDYSTREVGDTYAVMSPIGSVVAHDKLWVLQDDLRTHLVTDGNQRRHGAPEGLAGTVSQLERGYAIANVKGAATQWFDFSNGWIARDPRQGQVIGKLHEIDEQWVDWPDRGPVPESVAVIVDEESPSAYMSHAFEVNYWAVARQKAVFERLGAPFNYYLLKDVVSGKVPKFRCYFFLNCYKISDADRQWIMDNLQGDGRTLVWLYAPGYLNDSSLDVKRLGDLTGMQMTRKDEPALWRMAFKPDSALGQGLTDWQQPDLKLTPTFSPAPEGVQVEACYEGTDVPALAVKKSATWTSVYSAAPLLSPEVVKRLVRAAGVHITVESTEPSFVSRNLVALHTAAARTERLHFARPVKVTDLMTGEVLGQSVTDLSVELQGPQTRLLRIEDVP